MLLWNRILLFGHDYKDSYGNSWLAATNPQARLLRTAPNYQLVGDYQTIDSGDRADILLTYPGSVQCGDQLLVLDGTAILPNVRLEVGTDPTFNGTTWTITVENTGSENVMLTGQSSLVFPDELAFRLPWSRKIDGSAPSTAAIVPAPDGRMDVYLLRTSYDLLLTATNGFQDTYIRAAPTQGHATVSVRDFGALGNGVRDDGINIQSAIDYVSACGGGDVFLPAGTYGILVPLNLRSHVHLRGEGAGCGSVRVSAIKALQPMLMLRAYGEFLPDDSGCIDRVQLTDLEIDGWTGSTYATCGFDVRAARNFEIRRCRFVGINGTFVKFTQVWDTWLYDTYFDWAAPNTTEPMVDLQSYQAPAPSAYVGNTNSIHFVNCRWGGYRSTALRMLGNSGGLVNAIYLTGCQMESGFASPRLLDILYATRIILYSCNLCVSRFNSGMGDYIIKADRTMQLSIFNTFVNFQPVVGHGQGQEMPLLGLENSDGVSIVGGGYETHNPGVAPVQVVSGTGACVSVYGLIITNNQTWQLAPDARVVSGATSSARNVFSETLYVGAIQGEPHITLQRSAANGGIDGRWFIGRIAQNGYLRFLRGGNGWEEEVLTLGYQNGEARFQGRILLAAESSGGVLPFANGDATPSVVGGNTFRTGNSSSTQITMFDDGVGGQVIVVLVMDGNTTFIHGQGLALRGGASFGAGNGDAITFVWSGTEWREISRSEAS